jgi:plastocyanin
MYESRPGRATSGCDIRRDLAESPEARYSLGPQDVEPAMHRSIICLIPALLAGCAKDPVTTTPTPARHVGVAVRDNVFVPAEVTIRAGEDVTWVWEGHAKHGIQFFGSPTAAVEPTDSGYIYVRTFDKPGPYPYYCPVHGGQSGLGVTGMSGKVTVLQ